MIKLTFEDQDFFNAALNWLRWKSDYECLPENDLPVLMCKDRFNRFCAEYSVLRYEAPLAKERLREALKVNLGGLTDAQSVAVVAKSWIKAHELKKVHVSFATKLLAFRDPIKFAPMDRFSKAGLVELDGKGQITDYESYLTRFFDAKWTLEQSIAILMKRYSNFGVAKAAAFENRVLDCALMRLGGR